MVGLSMALNIVLKHFEMVEIVEKMVVVRVVVGNMVDKVVGKAANMDVGMGFGFQNLVLANLVDKVGLKVVEATKIAMA